MNTNPKNNINEFQNNKDNILKKVKKEDINIYFKKTFKNTISALFLSLITTFINFFCNIPLLRNVTKESYGLVKIHFEFAFSLVNYIPREAIRRASQKFCPDKDFKKEEEKYYLISQFNFLIFLIVIIISIIIFFCFFFFTYSKRLHDNYIHLIIYIICALIELLIEPVILYMNLHMENKFLPITISSISRVITNSVLVSLFNMDLWGFTLSRIIGTSMYVSYIFCLGFYKYKLKIKNFIPKDYKSLIFKKTSKNGINLSHLREIFNQFIKLITLNFLLVKFQNIILSFIIKCSDEEKSDYSFISQNFSLISRFLFEPIIDAFYNLINKIKYNNNPYIIIKYKNKNLGKIIDNNNNNIKDLEEKKIIKENDSKINYFLSIQIFQIFLKIFTFIGTLIIPYYILIGTNLMGLIYGKKWENNNIDKIGDCYSFYIILTSILDLVKSFGNATNNNHQMILVNISLIVNTLLLISFMYIFSKWDICGIIMANGISSIFLINCNLYIIFCGKLNKIISNYKFSIFSDIKNYLKKCFLSKKSIILTIISVSFGHFIKKRIIPHKSNLIKIFIISLIGFINIFFLNLFEYRKFNANLKMIKVNNFRN